ncbi:MAG TPA: YqgE/AlgH family protein [Candidatus Cybelea sp.]|nr:YqgE/AlgH family protein [Candidatus Cybelea sp.]
MQQDDNGGYLKGQLLVAMPTMGDPRFERSVIYLFAHSEAGAMGLVVNKVLDKITFPDLMGQLGIKKIPAEQRIAVHFGGPVDTGRGFVLHSADYVRDATVVVGDNLALTATIDVLKSIAAGQGPRRRLLALGYAGWAPGQLDAEIQANGWLHVSADDDLIFSPNLSEKWPRAVAKLGIDVSRLSGAAGHA